MKKVNLAVQVKLKSPDINHVDKATACDMKKLTLLSIFIGAILLVPKPSYSQDDKILQVDKGKVFITATWSIDSVLQIVILNANWRLDYVQKNTPYHIELVELPDAQQDSTAPKSKHKTAHTGTGTADNHVSEQLTRSFYVDVSSITSVNGIFRTINTEYRNIMQIDDDDYHLIKNMLPDTAAEYYVDGYKGRSTAALEALYLWGAPLRDWTVGFAVSIHNREAKNVLSSILCMNPTDSELGVKKIKLRQSNLLEKMSDSDMFCP
jgi:hypothetical protein